MSRTKVCAAVSTAAVVGLTGLWGAAAGRGGGAPAD